MPTGKLQGADSSTSQFSSSFDLILQPVLSGLGFDRVLLKDCMRPEYLYRKDGLWLGVSWDYRDRYLEVSLGRLHWFSDVMPRVVVIGDYSKYEPGITPDAIRKPQDTDRVMRKIAETLESAIEEFGRNYASIFQDFRVSRSRVRNIDIDRFIGPAVKDSELAEFLA
jgi:hypothetical protein